MQDLSPSEGIKYDPIDLEFDRFNGSAALFEERQEVEPLGRPVDIEVELDRLISPYVFCTNFRLLRRIMGII